MACEVDSGAVDFGQDIEDCLTIGCGCNFCLGLACLKCRNTGGVVDWDVERGSGLGRPDPESVGKFFLGSGCEEIDLE